MIKKHQGFTLLEIFVSLSLGLVLIGGVLSVFVGMKTTTQETSGLGELQENGRFAISILTEDLLRQNFWGDLSSNLSRSLLVPPFLANPVGDCVGGGLNNGSFPQATGAFRTIWSQTVASSSILSNCITDAVTNSDVIQIKRVVGFPIIPLNPLAPTPQVVGSQLNDTRYYLNAGIDNAIIFNGGTVANTAPVPAVDFNNARVWEYQHHVYYIRQDGTVPVLIQGRLNTTAPITFNLLVEGIERIHFMFGVDTDGDGVINAYIPPNSMLPNYWDNADPFKILGVKLYVLARSIRPDVNYENNNTYQMGDVLFTPPDNDNFRRLLFSTTISFPNATHTIL